MKRLWMHTLTGQLIAVMLLALLLSYGFTFFISHNEQQRVMYELRREDCLSRTTSLASLMLNTPEHLRDDVLRSINSPFNRFWLSEGATQDVQVWQDRARQELLRLRTIAPGASGEVLSAESEPQASALFRADELPTVQGQWEAVSTERRGVAFNGQIIRLPSWNGMGLSLRVRDGLYVNTVTAKPAYLEADNSKLLAAFLISAVTLSLGSVLVARRVGRPLRRLADMAERVGKGEAWEPLPEEGAEDIQGTAAAINRMQTRLHRFVQDRTNMIAAISHDLRTPITSLRLRAEFIGDVETREKIIETLDELQSMVEATLDFAREESVVEPTRKIDLDSMLSSLCDDLASMGWEVSFEAGQRVVLRCRPDALRRALSNVISNAVRYGQRARVRLEAARDHLDIVVDDDGPGIPEAEQERVFTPFVRLECSRNRDTGGVGLGLSIARTIVHAHGGEVQLRNRAADGSPSNHGGGLSVTVRLPCSP